MPNLADDDAPHPHVVDATMLWSDAGVRGYLLAKRDWLVGEIGWRHTIVAPLPRGERAASDCVDCGGLRLPGGSRLLTTRRAASRLLARQAPDLIEIGDPYRFAWAGLDAAQRLGVPAVAFCHHSLVARVVRLAGTSRGSWTWRSVGAYLQRLYNQFDLVLAPSDALVRELRDMDVTRVQRQPLGVDVALFHPARRDAGWRAALGVAPDTRVLVYAGGFAPQQNLSLLAQVVRRLGPRYLLLAIGDGAAPPCGDQVRVEPPPRDAHQLVRALASADAFVNVADQEAFGATMLQAMACGTPAVVRAVGALPELVDGGAGLTVRSGRIDEWAEAITALFAAGRDRWSTAARARALDHDWERVMPALCARYQRLLDGPLAIGSPASTRMSLGEVTQPAVLWHAPVGMHGEQ